MVFRDLKTCREGKGLSSDCISVSSSAKWTTGSRVIDQISRFVNEIQICSVECAHYRARILNVHEASKTVRRCKRIQLSLWQQFSCRI